MEYKNFVDYLFTKMEKNENNMSIYALTKKGGNIGYISPNEAFRLEIICKNNITAWTLAGYKFEEKHKATMLAFVKSHNEKADIKYKLHVKFNKLLSFDIIETDDDSKLIEVVDKAINEFTGCNEVTTAIKGILKDV